MWVRNQPGKIAGIGIFAMQHMAPLFSTSRKVESAQNLKVKVSLFAL
jgi:hypothetical protein